MTRKTFNVSDFIARTNERLSISTCVPEIRMGMMAAAEEVLHATGNYKGFRYLTVNEVPAGHKPGINISEIDGQHLEVYEQRFLDTDNTRIRYFG